MKVIAPMEEVLGVEPGLLTVDAFPRHERRRVPGRGTAPWLRPR
ncbi:hypothetical protein ACWGDT_23085 [Streptomyces avermitilis]